VRSVRGFSIVAAFVVGLVVAAGASASDRIVVSPGSLVGWRPADVSAGGARADLATGLPRRVRAEVGRAELQASRAIRRREELRSEGFVFSSPEAARGVLAAWGRAHAAHRVRLGQDGHGAVRRLRGAVTVTLAWREGSRVGLLVLVERRPVRDPLGVALLYGPLADRALRVRLPTTAWGRVLDEIRPDGTVSKQTALRAFAVVYGPLPGVRPPSGRRVRVPSGTLAGQWILEYRDRLSSAQRRIVDGRLGLLAPGVRRARAAQDIFTLIDPTFTRDPALQAVVDGWVAQYTARIGALGLTVVAGRTTQNCNCFADSFPLNASGLYGTGAANYCRVRVPAGEVIDTFRRLVLAHEVFHCFQFDLRGANVWTPLPTWIIEGMADWAALTIDSVSFSIGGGNLKEYIAHPERPLFERSYDAVGFFGHAQDAVPPLLSRSRLEGILNAGDNAASYSIAGGASENFASTWGSSVFRTVSAPEWGMTSPIAPPGFGALEPGGLTEIVNRGIVAAQPYTTSQYVVRALGDVDLLHFSIEGHARLRTKGTSYGDLRDAWFCNRSSCECPAGSEGKPPPSVPLGPLATLGLTGDPGKGTGGSIEPRLLKDFCKPKPKRKPGGKRPPGTCAAAGCPGGGPTSGGPLGCTGVGCGSTNGDPHVRTVDGRAYDFQAAGEFTLVESTRDDFDIQARQEPYPGSPFVSINSALAMRVGQATVEVDRGLPLVVRVDRRPVRIPDRRVLLLGGGGGVSEGGGQIAVVWPDGTEARVWSVSKWGVALLLRPAAARAGRLKGLLGNFDGRPANDFVGRDGTRYDADLITGNSPPGFHLLYGRFGESWRIAQSQSLFSYPSHRSTRSYTNRRFPSSPYTASSLPPSRRAAGERACRTAGITDPRIFADCVLDVGVTRDRRFAASAAKLQAIAGSAVSAGGWTAVAAGAGPASLAIDGSRLVAAYRRGNGAIEVTTLAPGAKGLAVVSRLTPFSGWATIGDPLLLPRAGGGLQMLFGGIRSATAGEPLSGVILVARRPDGSFGSPGVASSMTAASLLGAGAVLAADRTTPLWPTTFGGLHVFRGASNAVDVDLSAFSPGGSYAPTLAYDQGGRLWLAWYAQASDPARQGLYLLQLDPSTGGAAAGAVPVLAPASGDSVNNTAKLGLACARTCRLVYVDSASSGGRIVSWAPGDRAPTLVASSRSGDLRSPTAGYLADGRLWVAWADRSANRIEAKLGDAAGAGGTQVAIQPPPGALQPVDVESIVITGRLAILATWRTSTGASEWASLIGS
jgi:von Willebrand factor type D domain